MCNICTQTEDVCLYVCHSRVLAPPNYRFGVFVGVTWMQALGAQRIDADTCSTRGGGRGSTFYIFKVCVCVSTPVSKGTNLSIYLFLTAFFHLVQKQGDMACVQGPCPMKLPDARDMRADHSHVPAFFHQVFTFHPCCNFLFLTDFAPSFQSRSNLQ